MTTHAHTDLQAALDAEHAKCVALQAEIERLRGLLSREQQARHAALAEVDRITEAGRAHIRRAAAFEAQRDDLLACLRGCVEYVDETELRHVADYGEHHHAAQLARVREDAKMARAEPIGGCGACGDACQSRASCRLADESPRPAAGTDDAPKGCPECGQLGWHKMSCSHVAHERGARLMARLAPAQVQPKACRDDGRCQYAIDHGAEASGHCPPGKCAMPCEGGAA